MKIGLKNRIVQEIRVKLLCSTEVKETTSGSSYREVRKTEGTRNQDSTVYVLTLFLHNDIKTLFSIISFTDSPIGAV